MPADRLLLEISGKGRTTTSPLDGSSVSLGRSPENSVVLDDELVSRRHAALSLDGDLLLVTDLGSANGTQLNGVRLSPRQPQKMMDGDTLTIAPFTVTLRKQPVVGASHALPLTSQEQRPEGQQSFPGAERSVLIGRRTDSDLWLDDPLASRRHARLVLREGSATLEDLQSSNGTYVDGVRLTPSQPYQLKPHANVWIGNTHLLFTGKELVPADESRSISLDAIDINKLTSKGVNLLQNISLSIKPREFVVIVGPSGAGKSTLSGALSGLSPATSGSVLVNGVDLYENFSALRTNIGFVPQDDIIHRELPVRASLEYAAELRLPSDTSPAERKARVDAVIQTLGLSERQDVPVGALSGGQRKRVSIGVELLTSPGLFFLDEATSGLDPGTEAQMMRMLRELADEGHTILLVTHATKNVTMCDKVIFLAKGGHLAYFGPPAEALTYFGVDDFDGIYEKLDAESTPEQWGSMFRRSSHYRTHIQERLEPHTAHKAQPPAAASNGPVAATSRGLSQLSMLSRRYVDIIRRDRVNLIMMLGIAPVLGAVDFLAWPRTIMDPVEGDLRRTLTMLFLSSLIPFLVGAMSAIREVVKEAPIYRRERAAGLGVVPYVVSKTWIIGLISLYNGLIFATIKVIAVDITSLGLGNVLLYYVTIFLAVLSGSMWGLIMSCIVPREDRAMHLVAAVIVLQLVFSGGLLSLSKLGLPGTVLGGVTSVNWALRGATASLEIDTARCLGDQVIDCDLPGIQALETPAEKLVIVNTIERDFGDILGTSVYVSWAGMTAIIAVLFGGFLFLQKQKDRG